MYKRIDPFLAFAPELDVHGLTSDIVLTVVEDFIYENYRMGKDKIVVIHGKSGGVLKDTIHKGLKHNKYIKSYYLNSNNIGCTIIELKKERG